MDEDNKSDGNEFGDLLQNDAMLVLAKAVDDPQLSMEETGAAEELLALASEASLSSPIHQLEEKENVPGPGAGASDQNNIVVGFRSRNSASTSGTRKHVCNNCAATSTPFWRKSPDGNYYCNACGLYLRTHNTMRPLALSKNRETRRSKMRPDSCGNCGASDTPMWRKTDDGLVVCNACGLYYKLHNQHRQIGSKRSTKFTNASGDPAAINSILTKKSSVTKSGSDRTADFTLVHETSILQDKSITGSGTGAKYSLEPQFHHKFDPSRSSNSSPTTAVGELVAPIPKTPKVISGVLAEQPVDARKLAYLKNSQGRTIPLAPKLPSIDSTKYHHQQQQQQQSTGMPPILANFINSLASTSPEDLSINQVEQHPLQPLLTSIVSQKLKEQKQRTTPTTMTSNNNTPPLLPINVQAMQQQGYTADYWTPMQMAEFIQNQQQAAYNQQVIQQAIYNHQHQQQQHQHQMQPYGYMYHQQVQISPEQQQQFIDQQNYELQQQLALQHQQAQYQHYSNNNENNPEISYTHPHHPQHFQNHQRNQQYNQQHSHLQNVDQNYFMDQFTQFPEPPRQLSPFSGLKFDKNLIELVNMQFWQEQDASNGQEQQQHQPPPAPQQFDNDQNQSHNQTSSF